LTASCSLSAAGLFRHNKHISAILANSRKEGEILRADSVLEHLNHLTAEAARLKEKAEKAKDYRTALAGVREMSRLLELGMGVAIEGQERAFPNQDFHGRPLEQLTDVELLQILAREPGMTEAKFLRIACGENTPPYAPFD
jgi:hypothetical protein